MATVYTKEMYEEAGCPAELVIPEGIIKIGSRALYGSESLNSIVLPDSVTEIGESAFGFCTALNKVHLPNKEIEIDQFAFRGCSSSLLSFENAYYSLKNGLFINKKDKSVECFDLSIENVVIPEGVKIIRSKAFSEDIFLYYNIPNHNNQNTALKSVILPNSVTFIGSNAFCSCTSLHSIAIPDSVSIIHSGAFCGCSSLEEIVLPNSLEYIGQNVFQNCTSLKIISIPDRVIEIGYASFSGCTSLSEVKMPENLSKLKDRAFLNCTSLTNITIPKSVEELGSEVFKDCTSLAKVTLTNPSMKFGRMSFGGCTSITDVVLPETLTWKKVQSKFAASPWGKFDPKNSASVKKFTEAESLFQNNKQQLQQSLSKWDYTFETLTTQKAQKKGDVKLSITFPNGNVFYDLVKLKQKFDINSYVEKCQAMADDDSCLKTAYFGAGIEIVTKHIYPILHDMERIVLSEGMKEILAINPMGGQYIGSFLKLTKLKSVVIPGNIKYIGYDSFKGCTSLENVEICEGVETIGKSAFKSCTSLKKIVIPKTVKDITEDAFNGCKSLEEIDIPESLEYLGYNALTGCNFGQGFSWENNKISIKNGLVLYKYVSKNSLYIKPGFSEFYCIDKSVNNVEIPDGVREIHEETFKGCKKLETIKIPHTLVRIRKLAFQCCTSLKNIDIPDRVTEIENNAFERCGALKSIVIPESVSKIGNEAFKGCKSLTKVVIANPLAEIGENAFEDCKKLQEIEKPDTWTDEFGVVYSSDHKTLLAGNPELIDYSIKDGTEIINTKAFENCDKLKRIYIPNTLKVIGEMAFIHELEDVILPSSVERLEETTLWSFGGTLKILAVTPPELVLETEEEGMLRLGNYKAKILVPAKSVELYNNAPVWCKYQHLFEPLTD